MFVLPDGVRAVALSSAAEHEDVVGDLRLGHRRKLHCSERDKTPLLHHAVLEFIYGYMVSGIWLRTTQKAREETRCRHMGYSFRLAARVLLYEPSQTG